MSARHGEFARARPFASRVGESPRERGAGTLLVLGLAAVVLTAALALGALVAAQHARSAAQVAADLGALAGATGMHWGLDGCVLAQEVVAANGASLSSCVQESGGVLRVTATRRAPSLPTWAGGVAVASARAGPSPRG